MIRRAKVRRLGDSNQRGNSKLVRKSYMVKKKSKVKKSSKVVKKHLKCDKLIVFVAVVVATGLCTVQLHDIVQRFFRRPVTNCVKIVKSNKFKIPAFVLCPMFDNEEDDDDDDDNDDDSDESVFNIGSHLVARIHEIKKNDKVEECIAKGASLSDCYSYYYARSFDQLDVRLKDVWSGSKINAKLSSNVCRVAVNRTKCKANVKKGVSVIRLNSAKTTIFGGECVIVTQVEKLYYSPRSKGLKFNITTDSNKTVSRIAIEFVDNLQSVAYDMAFERTIVSSNSKLSIFNWKKFSYLNKKNSPCVPNDDARKCTERAMEDELVKLKLCNLPMLDAKRHPKECSTLNETEAHVKKLANWFLQGNVNKCARKCHDGAVGFRQVDADGTQSKSNASFTIHLANNVLEEISEEYAYDGSAALSDIAGNVGFYLGISLVYIITQPLLFLKNRLI